ncbi:uncharacterized protein C1orf115-like [Parambassis ranga]|uniref:Uncharacterized protein C1orf115-like n=1 Tax=Parambassis ranga TaxID=210632 RepID=A0A6P7HU93_9TELE|nr:uncharacterized protein C1orf115-like [Parambassis ranga]XP_028255658.1 uncharacterized protein C1orf115-like [Parambassis ranga]
MEEEEEEEAARRPHKTCREVYFSVLPDKYEPLSEEEEEETVEERRRRKEEKKRKKKRRYKRYRKNMGKALRFSWRCLLAGLQMMASSYSTPLSTVATVATGAQRASGSKAWWDGGPEHRR